MAIPTPWKGRIAVPTDAPSKTIPNMYTQIGSLRPIEEMLQIFCTIAHMTISATIFVETPDTRKDSPPMKARIT